MEEEEEEEEDEAAPLRLGGGEEGAMGSAVVVVVGGGVTPSSSRGVDWVGRPTPPTPPTSSFCRANTALMRAFKVVTSKYMLRLPSHPVYRDSSTAGTTVSAR